MASLTTYVFRDRAFSPSGDTHVCIVEREALSAFMSQTEVAAAFSGQVVYRRGLFTRYVGVWGRRNGKRLRRFLSERGAEVAIVHGRPTGARMAIFETRATRARIRDVNALTKK